MTISLESLGALVSKPAPALARGVEAGILVLCGAIFWGTRIAYPGSVDFCDCWQIAPLVLAICGIAFGAWLAWRGTAGGALVVGIAALWISMPWLEKVRQHESKTFKTLVFSTMGDSVRGAEIFVNGVDLGPSPARISRSEFERRVPQLNNPPTGFEDKVFTPRYGRLPEDCYEWDYKQGYSWDYQEMGKGTLYFQTRYAGETGVGSGSGGGGGGRITVGFLFPHRDRRLELLLNQARLADYHVSADWFRALETFDEDGWIAMRKAGRIEPGMNDVLSQWATWKYNLDAVHNSADAWSALMRVCSDADRAHVYLTSSAAGRAVEILARQVDLDQLVKEGGKVIARSGGAIFVQWRLAGQMQFGTGEMDDAGYTGDKMKFLGAGNGLVEDDLGQNQAQFNGTGGGYGKMLSPSGLVIAHALEELWNAGIGHAQMQSEIGPDLLAWHYDCGITLPLMLAAQIGGPQVDEFLLAQPWQRQVTWLDQGMTVFGLGNDDINRWFYVLAYLNDEAGARFRHEHATEILDMAGKLMGDGTNDMFVWDNRLDFLLLDHELARKFWPQFQAAIKKRQSSSENVVRAEFLYLEKTNAPASVFIDLWKQDRPAWEAADQGFGVLRFMAPLERARPIAVGLLDYFQHDPHAMDQITEPGNRQYLITCLQKIVSPDELYLAANRNHLSDDGRTRLRYVPDLLRQKQQAVWLSGSGGLSPVVTQLATAPEPALRVLSLIAIQGMPVSSNRQLLQKLLSDPDPIVQREARTVDAELQALAKQPASELTSSSSFIPPP